jgi:hypothetical protein
MGLYENIARLKEANLYNIVLVPFRLSASGRNKLHYYYYLRVIQFTTSTRIDKYITTK